jgi:hypothetical protein
MRRQKRAHYTFQHADDDAEADQLPTRANPHMQCRAQPPDGHAGGHVSRHAESAAQRGADGLQEDEEGEEDGHGRVQVVRFEAHILCEVRRLLPINFSLEHRLQGSTSAFPI